jgi:hypothetical protein
MHEVHVHIKNCDGSPLFIHLDTETLDILVENWKQKVSKITRNKGTGLHWDGEKDATHDSYLWLTPNQIVAIRVDERVESL